MSCLKHLAFDLAAPGFADAAGHLKGRDFGLSANSAHRGAGDQILVSQRLNKMSPFNYVFFIKTEQMTDYEAHHKSKEIQGSSIVLRYRYQIQLKLCLLFNCLFFVWLVVC